MNNQNITKSRFFSEIASVIVGKKNNVKFRVPSNKKRALQEVVEATNVLYQTLQSSDARLNEILPIIEKKHAAARSFHEKFGFQWIL